MFNRVVIIGVGLLGGSLARDLRCHRLAKTIIGVCRSEQTAKTALDKHIVDQVLPIEQAVIDADLIVFATPMQAMLPLLKEVAHLIPRKTILTDVGSVKTDLHQQIKQSTPELLSQFVLAHPIAGGENSGVSASQLGLFKNKHIIITETDEVDNNAIEKIILFWSKVEARVIKMSLKTHDEIFAKTSHLPHVVAFSLVNYINAQANNEQLFDLAAAGFYDFTRIASSNAEMWRDICITNKAEVLNALDGFSAQIDEIKEHVNNADQNAILEYFNSAKQARNLGFSNKTSLANKTDLVNKTEIK